MKIRYSQITIQPGQPEKNFQTCKAEVEKAKADGVNLLIFPEMAIPGYMIGDRFEENDFIDDCEFYSQKLASEAGDNFSIIFGSVAFFETVTGKSQIGFDGRKAKINCAYAATKKGIEYKVKTLLPNYRGFEEPRHFRDNEWMMNHAENWEMFKPVDIDGIKFGVAVCEDGWDDEYDYKPFNELVKNGAQILVDISYSPFTTGKNISRDRHFSNHAKSLCRPVMYVNGLGLQNNGKTVFSFDGSSTFYNREGEIVSQLPMFAEMYQDVEFDGERFNVLNPATPEPYNELAQIHSALIYGIRNYMAQCGLKHVVIGASGGVDSTLAAALYAEAIGKENLLLVNMPTRFNTKTTIGIAEKLAKNLGCYYTSVPIGPSAELTASQINGLVTKSADGKEMVLQLSSFNMENVQARDRGGRVLAAIASAWGAVFTNNGNKTEQTVGYATLYGDVAGFFAVIGDLWKHTVYDLCRYINSKSGHEIVPVEVLALKPSAELSDNQNPEEGKGDPLFYPYHDRLLEAMQQWWNRAPLHEILQHYLDGDLANYLNQGKETELTEQLIKEILPDAKTFCADLERWYKLFKGMGVAKRIQAPPILAVTRRAYGFDFRESAIGPYFTRKYLELKAKAIGE